MQHIPEEREPSLKEPSPSERRSQGTVSLKTYYGFFKAGGGLLLLIVSLLIFLLGEVMQEFLPGLTRKTVFYSAGSNSGIRLVAIRLVSFGTYLDA